MEHNMYISVTKPPFIYLPILHAVSDYKKQWSEMTSGVS